MLHTFLRALFYIHFANVTAILQLLRLAVAFGCKLVFGEKIDWRHMLANSIGISGMFFTVSPRIDGFAIYTY